MCWQADIFQQDCTNAPANCYCAPRICPSPTPEPQPTVTIPSMMNDVGTSQPASNDNGPSMMTYGSSTTSVSFTSTLNSTVVAMPVTKSPTDNVALIGGIVGGAVALLILGAVVAVIVARNRRSQSDCHSLPLPSSSTPTHYGDVADVRAQHH